MRMNASVKFLLVALSFVQYQSALCFVVQQGPRLATTTQKVLNTKQVGGYNINSNLYASDENMESNDDKDDEAEQLKKKADELRDQIRKMEEQLGDDRKKRNYDNIPKVEEPEVEEDVSMTLKKKKVLVVGANGRLGSMVCRYLLRNHPQCEVVAAVHYIGEDSFTARGYGRLSYEVGAEDGIGSIGAAWSAEDRVATYEFDVETMSDYNLQNLRLVDVELLDPNQCNTITDGVDSVIWCATDFNGNQPRAISGLNVAFLFRAVAAPTKGRVEIEGLQNILNGMTKAKQDKKWKTGSSEEKPSDPVSFVLVSTAPDVLSNFETPFGEFNGLKRQGENMLLNDYPSLSKTILQMGRYDDNFIEEGLDIQFEDNDDIPENDKSSKRFKRRINRRDAAKAAVDALTDEATAGKTIQVFTSPAKKD